MDELCVLREGQHTDLLLVDESYRLVVTIENKIDSGEHLRQLERYRRIVAQHYPNWGTLVICLTPDGALTSDGFYLAFDYASLAGLLEELTVSRRSTLGPDVHTAIVHCYQRAELEHHNALASIWLGLAWAALAEEEMDLARRMFEKTQIQRGVTANQDRESRVGLARVLLLDGYTAQARKMLWVAIADHATAQDTRLLAESLQVEIQGPPQHQASRPSVDG